MRSNPTRLLAALAVGALLVGACSNDAKKSSDTTGDTTADTTGDTTADTTADTGGATTVPAPTGWAVNTDNCVDPAAANAPIEGTIQIGSVMPLTGESLDRKSVV